MLLAYPPADIGAGREEEDGCILLLAVLIVEGIVLGPILLKMLLVGVNAERAGMVLNTF